MYKEKFLRENTIDGGFLQSRYWADFQKKSGIDVFEFENDNFKLLAIEHALPIVGKYWYIPRGPVLKFPISNLSHQQKNLQLLAELLKKAKKRKIGWIRIEPQKKEGLDLIKNLIDKFDHSIKIIKSKKNHQPAQTLMMDLKKNEEELLAQMKSKTRYNIKISKKRGVKIFQTKSTKDIEKFYALIKETAKRDKIKSYPREYYQKMLKEVDSDIIKLYLSSFDGEIIAGAIVSFFGGVASYLHGASSNQYRNVMAPYGLHWYIIQAAKKRNVEKYDLGGTKLKIKNNKLEPKKGDWEGITRFKIGFCPKANPVEFPGCWDVVLDKKKYSSYRVLQTIKDKTKQLSNL